jgi:hypothetical protein
VEPTGADGRPAVCATPIRKNPYRITRSLDAATALPDTLDFGSYVSPEGIKVGVIDVIQSAGAGGTAWQWASE